MLIIATCPEENELVEKLAKENRSAEYAHYNDARAMVRWSIDDIAEMANSDPDVAKVLPAAKDQAQFMDFIEKNLRDRQTETGWDVIRTLVSYFADERKAGKK